MTDLISRKEVIDKLKKAYFDKNLQSAKNDPCVIDAMTDWAIRQINYCASVNHWHTEPPTEDGHYFVAYRWGLDNQIMHDMAKQICYGATVFSHGTWNIEFPFVVLAWQRIEPYEEAST